MSAPIDTAELQLCLRPSCPMHGCTIPSHQTATLTVDDVPRSTVTTDRAETSTFAMSSIIFPSVARAVRTLKPLLRKGKRPTPLRTMESSTQQRRGF